MIGFAALNQPHAFDKGLKTLAPDRPNQAYEATRRFYEALGFVPVEVFPTLWGPDNPCLLMIKALAKPRS